MKKAFLQKRSQFTFLCIIITVWTLLTLCGCNSQNESENNEEQTKIVCDSHSMGSWYTHSQPDCSKEGEERRECSVCGEYEQRSTEKLSSHLYSNGKCAVCQTELTADTDSIYITSDGIVAQALTNKEHLVIPDTYNGKPVKGIEGDAFSACKSLKYVTLPASLKYIYGGFQGCGELREIFIGEKVEEIAGLAFAECNKLSRMIVAKGNEHFYSEGNCIISRKGALVAGCNFSTLTHDSEVNTIEGGAFYHRSDLQSIVIPDSVTKIGGSAFSYCTSLKEITLPTSLTSIEGFAFKHCTSLESINIPKNVTFIGHWAFDICPSLKKVEFENKANWYAWKTAVSVSTSIIAANNLTKEYVGYNWSVQK